jgi:iron-sulfur cluster repair protein YtfE (RIC family)
MDAIQYLERQHRRARTALAAVTEAPASRRHALWTALRSELIRHERIEEQGLYEPVVRDRISDPVLSEWVTDRHQDEAREIEALMREVDDLDPEDERWLVTVRQIRAALEHHMRQEEQDIFPRIGRLWGGSRLEAAGREMSESQSEPADHRG